MKWAIYNETYHPYRGEICFFQIEDRRREAIAKFCGDNCEDWRQLRRKGWRCVKIKLVPMGNVHFRKRRMRKK